MGARINANKLVWHGGWWPDAYAGLLLKVPEKGLTLVALGNTDGLHWGESSAGGGSAQESAGAEVPGDVRGGVICHT